jgi:hypothetical protein
LKSIELLAIPAKAKGYHLLESTLGSQEQRKSRYDRLPITSCRHGRERHHHDVSLRQEVSQQVSQLYEPLQPPEPHQGNHQPQQEPELPFPFPSSSLKLHVSTRGYDRLRMAPTSPLGRVDGILGVQQRLFGIHEPLLAIGLILKCWKRLQTVPTRHPEKRTRKSVHAFHGLGLPNTVPTS